MENKVIQKLDKKVKKIIRKGLFFNLLDRFYYYSIKLNQLEKLDLNEAVADIASSFAPLQIEIIDLTHQIKELYGIYDFEKYNENKKSSILYEPNLLGISPFLFININDWCDYILYNCEKYEYNSFYNIEENILTSLGDSLNRLNLDSFSLIGIDGKSNEKGTPNALYSLLFDDLLEMYSDNMVKDFVRENNLNKIDKNIERIFLQSYSTGNIVNVLIGSFKGAKALNDEQKREIRKFVSMIFVNKKGKRLKFKEIIDINFINANIKHLTETLKSEKKFKLKCWSNKKLSELICSISPNHFKLKTIENY